MRQQINLVIDADIRRLDASLPPIRARKGCEFVARVCDVPGDCSEVVFRVSTDGGAGFLDYTATCDANGEWTCRIPGAAFGAVGVEWYEIRAAAIDGAPTAIGRGRVIVGEWSMGVAVDGQADGGE